MAAAEARAVWQRTANRCFVQEDAKRAPKLACCPSTSSPSKPVDAASASGTGGQDNFTSGFASRNRNPSYPNLSPDSRWWLQLQPNHGYQRGLTNEQINTVEAEMEKFRASKLGGARQKTEELKTAYIMDAQQIPKFERGEESYELVEMESVGSTVTKELNDKLSLDSGFSWLGGEKFEPWWRTSDRDELASFVAQRSLDFIENCDLPRPQNTNFKRDPYADIGCFDRDVVFTSLEDWKPQIVGCPNSTVHNKCNAISGSACRKSWASVEVHSHFGRGMPISYGKTHNGLREIPIPEADPSKARLLEALRHSQTRAREAQKAAKEAYAEKEHVVKLFFKQASHLFAYKQWFRLLQLENLYSQIKNKSQPVSSLFPILLPHGPRKIKKMRKNWQKGKKRAKRGLPQFENDFSKYAVVFALGLSLVGAGLLLGWTVGWMLQCL